MLRVWCYGAFISGGLILAGCGGQPAAPGAATLATPARPSATAVPTPKPAGSHAPLTTSSGFRLDSGAPSVNPSQTLTSAAAAGADLQAVHGPKGTDILSPSGWRSLPPASLSQQICQEGICLQLQEDILVMAAPDGRQSLAVFAVDVPSTLPGGAILDGLVRGVVTGFSARAPDTHIVEGPKSLDLPGASTATGLQASFTADGGPATMFVEAAAQGQRVSGLFLITPDDYLQNHQDDIARIRSSLRFTAATN
jgi:hypothetical protein